DQLVLFNRGPAEFQSRVDDLFTVFKNVLHPLILTQELPVDGVFITTVLQFLDIRLTFSERHVCWMYHPRAQKPLLLYNSAHSKLVKRSTANMCVLNALKKSCHHVMSEGLGTQYRRLLAAGFPKNVVVSVAEIVLKRLRSEDCPRPTVLRDKQKVAVIPYIHKTAHGLKKVANRSNVKVVFSAPNKLSRLCRMTDPFRKAPSGCAVKHRNPFVECAEEVVYQIPLSCGNKYIGQTGRCVNDRLREHKLKVGNYRDGHLSDHCQSCKCVPLFSECKILARHKEKTVREIIEADEIKKGGAACVSVASIDLLDKE
ncbi:unnamed protein product, partial [Ixodes hexagonus]